MSRPARQAGIFLCSVAALEDRVAPSTCIRIQAIVLLNFSLCGWPRGWSHPGSMVSSGNTRATGWKSGLTIRRAVDVVSAASQRPSMQAAGHPPVVAGRVSRQKSAVSLGSRGWVCDEIPSRQAGPIGRKEALENAWRGRQMTHQSSLAREDSQAVVDASPMYGSRGRSACRWTQGANPELQNAG